VIKPRFLPAAEAELLKEVAYYSQARDGTGVRFQAAVAMVVEKAARNPEGGAPGPRETRSRLVKGFPFSVVYRVDDVELLVVAVAHHRRNPAYWAAR
jgi:plasmid stabilization system protein ParE